MVEMTWIEPVSALGLESDDVLVQFEFIIYVEKSRVRNLFASRF